MSNDSNFKPIMNLTGIAGLDADLTDPDRKISLTKYINEDNDKVYWTIETSVVNLGSEHDQKLVISDEALNIVLEMKDQINSLKTVKTVKWKLDVSVNNIPKD